MNVYSRYATFLYRYTSANLDTAGLAVGALTIVGGLGGNILGAKVADYFRPSVPNAYFLVPALFTIPGTVCLGLAVNMTQSFAINMVFLCLAQIFAWTSTAPMSSMSIASVPPPLRAKSAAVNLLIIHALGDVVSPPIIGALSDEWDSLRKALQITWAMTALAGVIWFLGFAFIRPLDSKEVTQSQESMREVERLRKQSDILLEDQVASARMLQAPPVPTYYNLVIARQPLMLDRASNTIVKRVTATLAQGHAGETLNAIHENVDDTNEAFEGNVESGPRDSTRPSDGQQSSEIR
jgi:MFS family permease